MLTSAPVLATPRDDPECTFVVDSDSSGFGASAVLQQMQNGKLVVIEFASRTFNAAERAHCATRREMAALIFGLKPFKSYLLGCHFQIRVDNQALSFYQRMKDATGQSARYLDFLSNFDFEIIHRNGSRHANADSVSRLRPCEIDGGEPCRQCNKRITGQHSVNRVQTRAQRRRCDNDGDGVVTGDAAADVAQPPDPRAVDINNEGGNRKRRRRLRNAPSLQVTAPCAWEAIAVGWSPDVLRDMQLKDADIGPAIGWVEQNERPPWSEVQGQSLMLCALWQQYASLTVINGVLYRSFYDPNGIISWYQLIIPSEITVPFLELIHNDTAGHLKYAKCIQHVIRKAWWLEWKKDLQLFIRCCAKCESHHRGQTQRHANLRPMIVGSPGSRWAIDLCGPVPVSNGYKYIFTAIDMFSKFGICVPLRNKEAPTVAKAIMEHIFLKWGLCNEILSDLGPEFQSELLSELLNILGVTRLRTSSYRPQTNGACEVWHRTLNSMLAKVVSESQRDWSEWLAYVTFAYNATEHRSTGFPPFYVFVGRMPLWAVDLALPDVQENEKRLPEFTAQVVEKLKVASDLVRQNLRRAAQSASNWYNKRANPRAFEPGDAVRIFYPRKVAGRSPKWQNFFKAEGKVVTKLNDATYLVKAKSWRQPKVVHVDKLKPLLTFH